MTPCHCQTTGHDPGCPNRADGLFVIEPNGSLRRVQGFVPLPALALSPDRDMIRWMAQTVHQAYHQDMPGTWETCPRDICSSAKRHLT